MRVVDVFLLVNYPGHVEHEFTEAGKSTALRDQRDTRGHRQRSLRDELGRLKVIAFTFELDRPRECGADTGEPLAP
jgi:hypothetical protein